MSHERRFLERSCYLFGRSWRGNGRRTENKRVEVLVERGQEFNASGMEVLTKKEKTLNPLRIKSMAIS
jgi:hypothetical protein